MAWTTPKTWANGTLSATDLNTHLRDQLNSAGTWTAYTPSWTSSGTAPALGNGTAAGAYVQLGDTIHFYATVTMGSTSTYGTGAYFLSMPFVAVSGPTQTLAANFQGATGYIGAAVLYSGAGSAYLYVSGGTNVGPTAPFTFANGHSISMSGTYRKA